MRVFKDKEEVLQLNNRGEQYSFYEDYVIDLKNFKHPGPQNLISEAIGVDFREQFLGQNHSKHAKYLVEKMRIGVLATDNNFFQPKFATELSEGEEKLHKIIDNKIDIHKPLLPQVGKLSKNEFIAFVNRPRYIDGLDNIQIHEDKDVDESSKTPIIYNIMCFTPMIFFLIYSSVCSVLKESDLIFEGIKFLSLFIIGSCFVWTVIEYYFHRIVLHPENGTLFPENPSPDYLMKIWDMHLKHHTFINQKNRICLGVKKNSLIMLVTYLVIAILISKTFADYFISGVLTGLLCYDLFHYYIHFGGEPWFTFLAELKAAHMRHHYRHPNLEYGVTTRMWDKVFGTDFRQGENKLN